MPVSNLDNKGNGTFKFTEDELRYFVLFTKTAGNLSIQTTSHFSRWLYGFGVSKMIVNISHICYYYN